MPRYEPYKSRYKGNYTRQIKNESKEINLKKPLIISVVFIISAAVIFSIVKNYAPIVDIAIKDFFSINHREAIALGNDEIVEDNSDKLSFLSNIPLFNFFIKSDTNQTLSVMAYETNSMLETVLSDNENLTNSTSINRESLLPFFNENFNTNYYNSSIYRENQNQNISENINTENNIINDNSNNNENETYNYIQQMINESGRNNVNNFVNSNNNSANNNSVRNNNSINNINNINNNSSNSQTASIFQDILKPKENSENIIKTMKPASTGFSSEIPSYMQNNNYNNNNNVNNRINNNPTNNYNNFFSDIEDRNENLNNNNNRERVINNSTQRDNRIENGNNNINNNYGRKNIIEETIFNNNSQKTSDYQRVINDMVNPNNIARDNRNNSTNNNLNNNANNNINNIKRETPANTKNDNKKEIMKKAASDVANYKRQKANNTINGINRISRDLNNIKTKSKDEGIYLVEYDENSGAITLIFRNRNFNNNISIENAIKTLLNGATDDENNKNIISCIPRNTQLLDIFVEDDIVYLNFNEDFEFNPLGNEGTMIQIYQLVYTATQFEGIDKVIFLINGNLNETIGAEGSIENTAFTRF